MFDYSEKESDTIDFDSLYARIDAVTGLLELERRSSEGEDISDEELDEQMLLCIDLAMAQETTWL